MVSCFEKIKHGTAMSGFKKVGEAWHLKCSERNIFPGGNPDQSRLLIEFILMVALAFRSAPLHAGIYF
jgi:hypothetical protein